MFLPLCKAGKFLCPNHCAMQQNWHGVTTLQGSRFDMVSLLCKAANLICSHHFAGQQTWHGQRSPAAHGHQLQGSPAPEWGWQMQWSAHSTWYCSLGWTWSCQPVGYSTSCAPLGPAQPPPLITRGTPHHKEYHSSKGVHLIVSNGIHHKTHQSQSATTGR